jgi:hypothetical protein
MAKTLLEIVQQASGELGLFVPNAAASSTAQDVVQMVYLANALGEELLRKWDWQLLVKEYVFQTEASTSTGNVTADSAVITGIPSTVGLDTTYYVGANGFPAGVTIVSVDSATQITLSQPATATGTGVTLNFGKGKYALPSDWLRQVSRTNWDKSKRWELLGPSSPQEWQWLKSSYISTGPRLRYRILGNTFQVYPQPGQSGLSLGFEYVSSNWVDGTASRMTNDADVPLFDGRLMVLGTKKKWLETKNFDTTAVAQEYDRELQMCLGQDADMPTLSFAPQPANILINWNNIPDAGYGTS